MLEASEEFKEAMAGGRILLKADINLADGTLVALGNESFMMGKASFTSASSSTNRFDIGAAIIGRFDFTLRNDERELDDYDFTGASVIPMLGAELSNGEVEWLQKGVYWIEQPEAYSDVVNFSALDNLSLFEKKYGEVPTTYPASLRTIVADMCSACGVPIGTPAFKHDDFKVNTRPSDDVSCIDVLSWAAQVSGNFADVDTNGWLRLRWYDEQGYDTQGAHAEIDAVKSLTVGVNEVSVSGLYVASSAGSSSEEGDSDLYGLDGYVLKITGNRFVEAGRAEEVADAVGPDVAGMTFRPLTARAVCDPTIEAGDPIIVTDRRGREYRSWATQVKWSTNGGATVTCGAERTSKLDKPTRKTAQEQIAQEISQAIQSVSPDHFYMYHGENAEDLIVSNETEVARVRFATVANTRVALNITVAHDMNLDGDVIARIYVNETLMKTFETYEARGKALLDFMWSKEFMKNTIFDVSVTLEPLGVISQIRENDADNLTLWNRARSTSNIYWQEIRDSETWGTMRALDWEEWASGTTASGTWGSIMRQDSTDWRIVQPTDAKPTITVAQGEAQLVLFGRGLAQTDSWDGIVTLYETMRPLSLVEQGLAVGFSDSMSVVSQTPTRRGISESFALSLTRAGLALGYSDAIAFGEDTETVWANDIAWEPEPAVAASKDTWVASGPATVTTVDFGEDRTVLAVSSVVVTAAGDVTFAYSADRGASWSRAMTADEVNAKTDWPAPPLRFRMEMVGGSRVNGMSINYERS